MTQIFSEDGTLIPVTVLQAGPCVVTQVKTVENDGYKAVQVGFVDKKARIINKDAGGRREVIHRHGATKPEQGHFKKAGVSPKRYVREFKFENAEEYSLGAEIKADIFEQGDKIDASAISKGKGFQGAIKRHGQHRGPMKHGSKFHRHQGSNGACSSPSRVFKEYGRTVQGQGDARTHGMREGHRPEPGSGESGRGEEPAADQGLSARSQEGISHHQRDRKGRMLV